MRDLLTYPSNEVEESEIKQLYENIPQLNYDLAVEAQKYCANDCIILYKIIEYFQQETVALYKIKDKEHIFDIIPNLTTSQMSLNVFRKMFQEPKFNLVVPTNSKETDFIRKGYRGAMCEVYVPETPEGSQTSEFDFRSKYPEVMSTRAFQIGRAHV